jgi:2-desacetyl-2-hydroxyethyl bacteriochlorophyllide A dehydrogenase
VKAVVIEGPGRAAFRDVETPTAGPEDVLVRSHKAGVCRTDIEVLNGVLDPRWIRYPCIPGHEWAGSVAAVGSNVTETGPGDQVVCEGIIPCLRCRRCKAGETNLCENYDQLGFTRPGGYGEYVAVPRHVVHRLPPNVSLDAGVLVEPAAVVLRGILRGRAAPGESVGVVGVGTLGALAVTLLHLSAPAAILAYGIREEELELARRLGAGKTVNVAEEAPEEGTLDLVLECAGSVSAVELATRLVREGGRIVQLGIAGKGAMLEIPADRIALRDVELIGSVSYTSAEWTRVVSLLSAGLVDLNPIVTHHFPVSEWEKAFALMDSREGIVGKVVLEHAAD